MISSCYNNYGTANYVVITLCLLRLLMVDFILFFLLIFILLYFSFSFLIFYF